MHTHHARAHTHVRVDAYSYVSVCVPAKSHLQLRISARHILLLIVNIFENHFCSSASLRFILFAEISVPPPAPLSLSYTICTSIFSHIHVRVLSLFHTHTHTHTRTHTHTYKSIIFAALSIILRPHFLCPAYMYIHLSMCHSILCAFPQSYLLRISLVPPPRHPPPFNTHSHTIFECSRVPKVTVMFSKISTRSTSNNKKITEMRF